MKTDEEIRKETLEALKEFDKAYPFYRMFHDSYPNGYDNEKKEETEE